MSTDTPDQQITRPIGTDSADNPVAFINAIADMEQRLVRNYVDAADRTARRLVVAENQISTLAAEDRVEVWTGSRDISLHTRSLFAYLRKNVDAVPVNNSTVLVNDADLFVALPDTGTFGWRTMLFYDSSTVADIKFAHTMPAGANMRWGIHALASGVASGTGDFVAATSSASGGSIIAGGAGAGTTVMAIIEGEIFMAGTAGNLQLQWAQNTAEVSDTIVRARSRMKVWRSA